MIGIIDAGINNLLSLQNAFHYLGADLKICTQPADIQECERIILPGVGAFGALIQALSKRNLVAPLHEAVLRQHKPTLGICVGMQIMGKSGHEYGVHEGLGWFDSEVVPIAPTIPTCRIPHVGWNSVTFSASHPMARGLDNSPDFYFVHSFQMICKTEVEVAGWSDHGGRFVAAIARDNIFASQFHPEKSQSAGLRLLGNFVQWQP